MFAVYRDGIGIPAEKLQQIAMVDTDTGELVERRLE
jgi:hypothetical protein